MSSSYPLEDEKTALLEDDSALNGSKDSPPSHSETEDQTGSGLKKRGGKKKRPRTLSFELRRRMDEAAAIEAFKSDPRFNRPPPSVLSRLLLIAFLVLLLWLAVRMRMTLLDDKRHGKSRAASALRHLQSALVGEL
ncbi:hypothetical protein MD484_g3689, partial [Candolleomyces efflorescens]